MKNIIIALLLVTLFYGCNNGDSRPVPEGYVRGVVTETVDAGGYTYMKLDVENVSTWIAAVQMPIAVGDTIYYTAGSMEMKNFHSKTMNKTFEKIIFADEATKDPWKKEAVGKGGGMMGGANPHESAENDKVSGLTITPDEGGLTIEQVYAQKTALNGKTVKVKGQVVKYNGGILNKNWVHIQDGTGSKEDYDLVITTSEVFNLGDVVTFEGKISVDKDFGSGYKFSVIIEDAKSSKALKQS